MKAKTCIGILFLSLFVVGVFASEQAPLLVSPGSEAGIAVVGEGCPTFSWTEVEGSTAYRVEIYNAIDNIQFSYEEMSAMSYPVLTKEILGAATSWTPSSEQSLAHDGLYVWYVKAIDEYGNAASSAGMCFKVYMASGFAEIETTITKSLIEYDVREDIISEILDDIRTNAQGATPFPVNPRSSTPTVQKYMSIQGAENGARTYYGIDAGNSVSSGSYLAFFGYHAGYSNTTGNYNTFIGDHAGKHSISGNNNTFVGSSAGYATTYGNDNTFIGSDAGASHTTGYNNTFIGYYGGRSTTTGYNNVYIGNYTGFENTTGFDNTYLGTAAGRNNITGQGNVFLGRRAGYNETGSNKLFIDNSETNNPLIWGDFNTDTVAFMGTVGVGTKTPSFPMEMKKTGVNASIVVDRTDGATNYINATATSGNFGTVTNHVLRLVVNSLWRLRIHTDNSLTMRNGASCTTGGVWTNASSRDLKDDINDLSAEQAIEALNNLQPVTYKYKADMEDEHVGFIAEDVPELVASKDRKGMSPMDVVAVLTKVLQEQQEVNKELQDKVDILSEQIEELKKQIQQ